MTGMGCGRVPKCGLASGHLPDVVDQIEVMDPFEHKTCRPFLAGRVKRILVGKSGQDENPRVWRDSSGTPADIDAGSIWKVEVEHNNVRLVNSDPADRVNDTCRLGHDLDVGLSFDERAQAMTHQFVVIDEHDANWWPDFWFAANSAWSHLIRISSVDHDQTFDSTLEPLR